MASSEGHFKKGQSGNPGGRPKGLISVVRVAREHTEEAIRTLVITMRTAKDPKVRCAAACALLDRGWGRPVQTLQRTDYDMPPAAELPAVDHDVMDASVDEGEHEAPLDAPAENPRMSTGSVDQPKA